MVREEKSVTALQTFNLELLPDRQRSVVSDEGVRRVVFVGHVAVMTQVEVVALSTLPANTAQFVHTTHVAIDFPVVHT